MDTNTFGLETEISLGFVITQRVFLRMLETTYVVVPAKDVIPILANFQIQASPTSMRVVTTNLEISMICATKAVAVSQAGEAFFPARRMMEIIKECNEDISVVVENQIATITSDQTTWTLKLSSGIGFPAVQKISDLVIKEIDAANFSRAINTVKYAASLMKSSMMMLCIENEKIIACDGVRLHQAYIRDFPFNLQIPIDAVDDILKIMSNRETIKIGNSPAHIVIQAGSDVLIINKLAEEFPDVVSLILGPALRNKTILKVNVAELKSAIKAVRVNADLDSPAISLEISESGLILKSVGRYGTAQSGVDIKEFKGKFRTLVFNHRMLMQALGSCESVVCEIRLAEVDRNKKLPILIVDEISGSTAVLQQMISATLEN